MVSSVPDIVRHTIDDTDEFLLLACDGVWDVLGNDDAVRFVRKELRLARKQCLRILAENFGRLHVDVVASRDINRYTVGSYVDFPKSRDGVKGWLMKKEAKDGVGGSCSEDGRRGGGEEGVLPGRLFVRPTPPEAWEGGMEGEADKSRVGKAWPCGIVCENLLDHCLDRGSTDNLSAILVLLGKDHDMDGHDSSTVDALQLGGDGEAFRRAA